jgi:hypothetical protein
MAEKQKKPVYTAVIIEDRRKELAKKNPPKKK